MKFNALMPELYVTNYQKSFDFYTKILGFKFEYGRTNPPFAFFSYFESQIMIQELAPGEKEEMKLEYPFGRGMNFEIKTPDLSIIINALQKNHHPLTRGIKESWRDTGVKGKRHGSQEILVNDPDGYLLRFSQNLGEKSA
ncbi:MAG: VOC family protein [Patescibacteria group bacterium]